MAPPPFAQAAGNYGLWQVEGRSRVGFDDMVFDLRYARQSSPWLDLRFSPDPKAVLPGGRRL